MVPGNPPPKEMETAVQLMNVPVTFASAALPPNEFMPLVQLMNVPDVAVGRRASNPLAPVQTQFVYCP